MLAWLEQIDQELLIFINHQRTPWLDFLMFHATDKWIWIPLYILLVYFVYRTSGLKNTIYILMSVALLVVLCDRSSVVLFKNYFQRFRPCHNTLVSPLLIIMEGVCKGKYGFVSSHGTNSFGLVTFFSFMMPWPRWAKISLILWACLIGYTRIYLGVHYPSDVFVGALLGTFCAYIVYRFVGKKISLPSANT